MNTHAKMAFSPEVAKDVGTDAAIILNNIEYWCFINKSNEINFHDNSYWTYNSVEAFNKIFPYLTPSKIKTCLNNLEEKGYIKSGNYNKKQYDRTKWYTIGQFSPMHLSDLANPFAKISQPIPDNKPNNKPDNNITNNKKTDIEKYLPIFDEFRKSYPGIKKGNETEFTNFRKKTKDWEKVINELSPILALQLKAKSVMKDRGEFVPMWKNLTTWINNRCWEEEYGTPATSTKLFTPDYGPEL